MASAQPLLNRLCAGFALTAALTLGACVSTTALDQLATTTPTGSAFAQQLFRNYAYLANSFSGSSSSSAFDSDGSISLFDGGSSSLTTLAEAFAAKALIAANGTEVEAEPAIDTDSQQARSRLLQALSEGKDRFPADAARAQTDFDCWMLNSSVEQQRGAAGQCRASFGNSIARLENEIRPPAPPPAPVANYKVYFDFDSWTISGEQLTVLQQAIATARAGGQSRITIVGHTDTSGSAAYNQRLSERRANVVAEALVDMGARREAIQVSGVGESDLEVPTRDGVREPRNRRAIVTLLP
jgi:OOP family OmpA-OmpF porin